MRVLVTRPLAEGEALAAALLARGHEPVVAPVLAIVPLPVRLPGGAIDAVIATSPQALAALDAAPLARVQSVPCYVVGGASAAAARARGFRDLRVGAGDGVALVDLVRLTCPRGAHLLHLAGRIRKRDVEAALVADGYAFTIVETYDAQAVPDWATTVPEALADPAFDACLHFSRRSAALALAGSRGSRIEATFESATHLCLSADVAAPLREAGFRKVVPAKHATTASLLQALTDMMSHRS